MVQLREVTDFVDICEEVEISDGPALCMRVGVESRCEPDLVVLSGRASVVKLEFY